MTVSDRIAVMDKGIVMQVANACRNLRSAQQPLRGGVHWRYQYSRLQAGGNRF